MSSLHHKLMKIGPTHLGYKRNDSRIAYKMCDSSKRERILEIYKRVLEE